MGIINIINVNKKTKRRGEILLNSGTNEDET
jgi:hypothetical protein